MSLLNTDNTKTQTNEDTLLAIEPQAMTQPEQPTEDDTLLAIEVHDNKVEVHYDKEGLTTIKEILTTAGELATTLGSLASAIYFILQLLAPQVLPHDSNPPTPSQTIPIEQPKNA
jgi:hypothetical protein